ncbi:hypothetical protein EXIGLDRAFT_830255 [Exidia glandulosa HHB12029]|uniref:F-box domain-containing protein n=1 Tax=Exidia glandulosa HHB12029 TaxID=1314781 RepID=A0A165NPX9_EXIGL|nr:hypothetical protein EXIGLDRAFT_830255 [Exidia glandulosa HHB12029]
MSSVLNFNRLSLTLKRRGRPSPQSDALCVELIDAILEYVSWPTDLYALSLVSRAWHARASPLLWATLPVLSDRPERTLNLLDTLELDEYRAKLVHTVLFDTSLRHDEHVRTTRHYGEPHVPLFGVSGVQQRVLRQLAHRLADVLPLLTNVRTVRMGHVHPLLMSVHTSVRRRSLSSAVWHSMTGRLRSRAYHDLYLLGEGPTTWVALACKSDDEPTARIERLSARLWSRCAPPQGALAHLRILSLTWAPFYDWSAAGAWSDALLTVPRLEVLMLSDLTSSPTDYAIISSGVLDNIFAPRLRELVFYRLRILHRESAELHSFMVRHCKTLESVGVALRPGEVGSEELAANVLGLRSNNAATADVTFPRLRRLRVHNAAGYPCTSCALSSSPEHAHGHARDPAFPDTLFEFVRRHPLVLQDFGATGLPKSTRRDFDELVASSPNADRVNLMGGGSPRFSSTCRPLPKDALGRERWVRDAFLLEGTELDDEPCDAPGGLAVLGKAHKT